MKIMFLGSLLATKWLAVTAKYRVTDFAGTYRLTSRRKCDANQGPAAQAHRG